MTGTVDRNAVLFALRLFGLSESDIGNMEAIESAYRRLARTVHPDVCSGPESTRLMSMITDTRNFLRGIRVQPRQTVQPWTVVVRERWSSSSPTSSI